MKHKVFTTLHDIVAHTGKQAFTIIPSYHKGEFLPRIKNTFMYTQALDEMPAILFLQDPADLPKYDSWVQDDFLFWSPTANAASLNNIAKVRKFILSSCYLEKIKYILMMDDDLRFSCRKLPEYPTKWIPLQDDKNPAMMHKSTSYAKVGFIDMLEALIQASLDTEAGIISVVQRFGSQNKLRPVWNNRILHLFFMDLERLSAKNVNFDDRYAVVEDFRFLFDCAKAGVETLTLVKYVQDDYTGNTPGGCNEWRNGPDQIAVHNEAVKQLAKDYPEFCEAVWELNSPYNENGAWNPRVNWKRVNDVAKGGSL